MPTTARSCLRAPSRRGIAPSHRLRRRCSVLRPSRNGAGVRRIWAVLLVASLLLVPVATASAHEDARKDGDDARGPLDLRSGAVGHKGEGSVTHTLTTYNSWKPKVLRNGSYFALAFDTD